MGTSDPQDKTRSSSKDGAIPSLVGVQSLISLGLLLPAAVVAGWALGSALDHWLHQHWIYIAGLIFGAVAGFVQIFRIVLSQTKE